MTGAAPPAAGGGMLFLVVGPSGAGKDTLIDGARAALAADPSFIFARRQITRPEQAGGEAHQQVSQDDFAASVAAGKFLAHWQAHGWQYGLPAQLAADLAAGRHVIANVSRGVVTDLASRIPHVCVLHVTAPLRDIGARLAGRGREEGAALAARLQRTAPPFAAGLRVIEIGNDADIATGVERFLAALQAALAALHPAPRLRLRAMPVESWRDHVAYLREDASLLPAAQYLGPDFIDVIAEGGGSVRARVHVLDAGAGGLGADELGLSRSAFAALGAPEGSGVSVARTPAPESRAALRAKIRGEALDEGQFGIIVRDIVEGRYPDREVAGFLVSAAASLTDAEVAALARVRARYSGQMVWHEKIVADKHSLGGIPGSRITMIVVPIVAAHGMAIPKTSSRAITSAAGTADAMEVLADVDLSVAQVRDVVERVRGCVVWNGRLNHSPIDDVMNAITRPLGIDSLRWSVASILSKKLAAGATHVAIDIPYGARAKTPDLPAATALARLFEAVGAALGLVVAAFPTDGSAPVGRGIGPALEVRDVLQVLENDPAAPADLAAKALFFAGRILAFDPAVPDGPARARQLLASGAARAALDRIVQAQGRRQPPAGLAPLVAEIRAPRSGVIGRIDGWRISGLARRAGAPAAKGAGIDLLVQAGQNVAAGQPLYLLRAEHPAELAAVQAAAAQDCGFHFQDCGA